MRKFNRQYIRNYSTLGKSKGELRRDVKACSTLLKDWSRLDHATVNSLYDVGYSAMNELFLRYGDFALWSMGYINSLPDSAFLWIEAGGTKGADGKTEPRSLRHLPYRTYEGKLDMPHVRNALARLNQVKAADGKPMPTATANSIRETLQKLLDEAKDSDSEMFLDFTDQDFAVARVFAHPTGKNWMTAIFKKYMTPHKKYVEPFAGSATLFFSKDATEESAVLNDLGMYSSMLSYVKELSDADIAALVKKPWVSNEGHFTRLRDSKPQSKLEALYRFCYLQRFSFGAVGKSYAKTHAGEKSLLANPRKWQKARDRLKVATITKEDYRECIRKHDGPDTYFYLDPPYYDTKDKRTSGMNLGEIKLSEFIEACKGIKGKFIATIGYGNEWSRELKKAGFYVYNVKSKVATALKYNPDGSKKNMLVPLISNYPLTSGQKKKAEQAVSTVPAVPQEMEMQFTNNHYTETVEVHSVDGVQMSSSNPQWLELTGILFHRGKHKGIYYTDDALKGARMVPRDGEKLCYVNFYHKKDEKHRVGMLGEIWWDADVAWHCPNNNENGKGALMYRSFITDKDAISEVLQKRIQNVSAELHFDSYYNPREAERREYAAHVEVQGKAITDSPALRAADIESACTVGKDGKRSCQSMNGGSAK